MPSLARVVSDSPGSPDDAVALHDRLAAGWSARYRRGGFARRRRFLEVEVLESLPIAGTWLDAGCGAGDFTRWLAAHGAQACGLDASGAMIAAARRSEPSIAFDQGLVESLTDEAAYDGALCLSVLEYLDDPDRALSRLAAALKPGGRLVISAPRRLSLVRAAQRSARALLGRGVFAYLASSRVAWGRTDFVAALEAHGLAIETLRTFDPVLPRPLWPFASLWVATCRRIGP